MYVEDLLKEISTCRNRLINVFTWFHFQYSSALQVTMVIIPAVLNFHS